MVSELLCSECCCFLLLMLLMLLLFFFLQRRLGEYNLNVTRLVGECSKIIFSFQP